MPLKKPAVKPFKLEPRYAYVLISQDDGRFSVRLCARGEHGYRPIYYGPYKDEARAQGIVDRLNARLGVSGPEAVAIVVSRPGRDEWLCGYAAALGAMRRLFHHDSSVASVLQADGLTVAHLQAAGVEKFDLDPIKAATGWPRGNI
jgi:hypothetical protein